MGQPGTPEDLAAIYDNGDGVHPNEAGTTFMADTMATAMGL
jgi:lysophospholipase L1-like esterase